MTFSSRIFKIGINPVVNVPARVLKELFKQAGKTRGPIPVKGKLNGRPFIQTVVKFRGTWQLYLNMPMRQSAGIDEGDMAHVEMDFDSKPRVTPVHPQLKELLSKNKKLKEVFDTFPPSRQKEISRYLNSLKTEESVKKNVEKVITHLTGKGKFAGRNPDS